MKLNSFMVGLIVAGAVAIGATALVNGNPASAPITGGRGANDPLVKVAITGGDCPYGMCSDGIVITAQGSVVGSSGSDHVDVERLQHLIDTTNFDQLRSKPFSGQCPAAYDGPEFHYTFYSRSGIHSLDSCESDLSNSAVIKEVSRLIS